jgi:hypothetical protein
MNRGPRACGTLERLTLHTSDHKRTEVSVLETLAKTLPAAVPLVRGDGRKFLGKAGLNRSVEVAALQPLRRGRVTTRLARIPDRGRGRHIRWPGRTLCRSGRCLRRLHGATGRRLHRSGRGTGRRRACWRLRLWRTGGRLRRLGLNSCNDRQSQRPGEHRSKHHHVSPPSERQFVPR